MSDIRLNQNPISQKQEIKESLSALVDGEASDLELRRILKACDRDPELRQCWSRYQLLSQALKNDSLDISVDLSTRISEAIANEPSLDVEKVNGRRAATVDATSSGRNTSGIWSGVGRFAIAASVAAAVVLGVQYTPVDQSAGAVVSAPPSSKPLSEQIAYESLTNKNILQAASHLPDDGKSNIKFNKQPITISANDLEKIRSDRYDLQRRINRLMLEHVENVSQNNYQGILPYARVPSGK